LFVSVQYLIANTDKLSNEFKKITRKVLNMKTTQTPDNCILTALPEAILVEWGPHMQEVQMSEGEVICDPGRALSHMFFPTTAIASWQYLLATGDCTEIAMVGREGAIGLFHLMGSPTNMNQAVVQTTGTPIRIPMDVVLTSYGRNPLVQRTFMLFAQALMAQMSQGNVCRQHHSLEMQLSRLILMILDRQPGQQVDKTHEAMAQLLGVRREGVSLAASKLMKEGWLSYSRGHIQVLNREGLIQHSCECYHQLRQHYKPMLKCAGQPVPSHTETI
jgi:CRP-like cAMP-binding protein